MRPATSSVLCLVGLSLPQVVIAQAPNDVQKGEAVLGANNAPVDAPLRRHPKSPWYQLSNLRKLNDVSSTGDLAVDFRREGGESLWHEIVLIARDSQGRREYRSIGLSPFAQPEGSVRGQSWFGRWNRKSPDEFEVWLELHQNLSGKVYRQKVSNSVTLGNVGQKTYAREWNADEQKAFESWEKSMTPPPAPPPGYVAVVADTQLLPGMPVLAGWMAEWKPAEVIDVRNDGAVLIKYRDVTTTLLIRQRNWLAVETKTLDAARANPSRFAPSVRVLPNGITPITDDLAPVTSATPLVKGVPLKAEWGGSWHDVTVLEILGGERVRIHWDGWATNWDEDRDYRSLAVTKLTLTELAKPSAKEEFAERLSKLASSFESAGSARTTRRQLIDYPIKIAIPDYAVRVTDKTPLQVGTKLSCSWGNSWYDVTVLAVYDDGNVKIHWDNFGDAWDGDISRDCLVVEKKGLQKLEAQARASGKANASKNDASEDSKRTRPDGAEKFRVVLTGVGNKKVAVTKVIADVTGLDLKDAKEFVESPPLTVKQGLSKEAAEKLKKQLEDAGGTARIEKQ